MTNMTRMTKMTRKVKKPMIVSGKKKTSKQTGKKKKNRQNTVTKKVPKITLNGANREKIVQKIEKRRRNMKWQKKIAANRIHLQKESSDGMMKHRNGRWKEKSRS